MSRIRIIKKNDEYTSEYDIGDIFEVEGTWYGGVHITGKTGVPISLDREEYMELDTEPEPEPMPEELQRDIRPGDIVRHLKESGFPRKLQNICTKSLLLPSIRKQEKCW